MRMNWTRSLACYFIKSMKKKKKKKKKKSTWKPVSYTHLTLPTIYSV